MKVLRSNHTRVNHKSPYYPKNSKAISLTPLRKIITFALQLIDYERQNYFIYPHFRLLVIAFYREPIDFHPYKCKRRKQTNPY